MNSPESQPLPHTNVTPERRPYHAPTVQDLGPWTVVTLEYSVGFNQIPGMDQLNGGQSGQY